MGLKELTIATSDRTDFDVDADLEHHFKPILGKLSSSTLAVHERKGMAILRRVISLDPSLSDSVWSRTISTDLLVDRAREGRLEGGVLLIDDLLRTGRTVVGVVKSLLETGFEPSNICVAVLGSHESFDTHQLTNLGTETRIWRKHLGDRAYSAYRSALVRTLGRRPDPVLDTEHLELSLQFVDLGHNPAPTIHQLADALARTGQVVVPPFDDDGGRLAVMYPTTERHPETAGFGLGLENPTVVRKSRITEITRNHYTIRPICLPDSDPSARLDTSAIVDFVTAITKGPAVEQAARTLFTHEPRSAKESFFRTALLASLLPLRWTVEDVYAAIGSGRTHISLYGHPLGDKGATGHLPITYPGLNIEALDELLTALVTDARGADTHRVALGSTEHLTAKRLAGARRRLLQAMSIEVDLRLYETELGARRPEEAVGLEHFEVLCIGSEVGLSEAQTSALLDDILDRALFSTKVETAANNRTVRTYKPDGEVTTQALRSERRSGDWH